MICISMKKKQKKKNRKIAIICFFLLKKYTYTNLLSGLSHLETCSKTFLVG